MKSTSCSDLQSGLGAELRLGHLGLTLLAFLLAGLLAGAAFAQPARAAAFEDAEQVFLYLSANGIYARDVAGADAVLLDYVSEGRPLYPSRALNGAGYAWMTWPLEGPELIHLREEVTTPGTPTTHVFTAAFSFWPRISPDATRVLYVVEEEDPEGGVVNNLHTYDATAEESSLLIPLADAADWSPDGSKVVYTSYPLSRTDPQGVMLYVLDLGTSNSTRISVARRVNENEANIYAPRWSPSGQWIAFQRYDFGAGTVSVVITTPLGATEEVVLTRPMFEIGQGMEWVRLPGGSEHLYIETAIPGSGPYSVEVVPGVGGAMGGDSILHASFSSQGWPEFSDVPSGSLFAQDIRALAALRILGGFDDGTFRSGQPVKRAQYAKMISIAVGLHDASWTNWSAPSFPDVPRPEFQDEEFRYPFDFVEEAAAHDLIKGDLAGRFNPWANIARVHLALILARAADGRLDPPLPADYEVFTDTTGLSAEAKDAIALAYHHGIINGKTPTTFVPYADATRGQAAAMTARFLRAMALIGEAAG